MKKISEQDAQRVLEMVNTRCRGRYESGQRMWLFYAINTCSRYGLPLPEWVHEAFELGIYKYGREAKTLDEAFGPMNRHKKGMSLAANVKRLEKSPAVFDEVTRREKEGEPICEALFESVGKPLGLSMSVTRTYYYDIKFQYLSAPVYLEVKARMKETGLPLEAVFATVAETYDLRRSEVKKYYKHYEKRPDWDQPNEELRGILVGRLREIDAKKVISDTK